MAQWNTSSSDIYNSNTGNVGIGNNSPLSLLYVGKNMTEPTITVRNLGGAGGASFRMWDNASSADWKFKATNTGGFKIRDNAYGLDVITIESNSSANMLYLTAEGNIGIGIASPEPTAAVIIDTYKGVLIPRMTQSQIQSIVSPANGLQVYCTTDGKVYVFSAYFNHWQELAYGAGTIAPTFVCGAPIIKNHTAGNVAPVNKSVTYGTVTNVPGETSKCWITRNLGASQQATAVNDNTEASAGWLWQFNRKQGYKVVGATRTPNTTWITSISENSNWSSANDPCANELGSGWRVPVSTEWSNVLTAGGWTDWNGPWNSLLKVHAAGYLTNAGGMLLSRGTAGYYWSSTQWDNAKAYYFAFMSNYIATSYDFKAYGYSLRCIKS
jgi:hypothetical protein